MSDSVIVRSGLGLDPYPERDVPRAGWAERLAVTGEGFLRQRVRRSARGQGDGRGGAHGGDRGGVVERVNAYAAGLENATQDALQSTATELRIEMASLGLTETLALRAFALVRELAARTLGMRYFDVQVVGGWAILNGMVAEMHTGEGKTLTATLPACAAALAGVPVHVVTVNDYLVERDAQTLAPLYAALGITVGTITEDMDTQARRAAYACDVTYCTNKQLVFDYLRDRLAMGSGSGKLRQRLEGLRHEGGASERLLLRGLCFAIVDEADSVLVDEARTPLIISRTPDGDGQQQTYIQAVELARRLDETEHYEVRRKEHDIELTPSGKARLAELAAHLGGPWSGARWREEFARQALCAIVLYQRDRHYLVKDDKVQIIDEYTGRAMPDRSWEKGLHQMVESIEGCEASVQPETLARMSYQRFFRRYLLLGGMSGTVREVTGELWSVYRLDVLTVPTHRPIQRKPWPTRIFATADARWDAVVERVRELRDDGRPILIGTRTVGASELLSARLDAAGIEHVVLNARHDGAEAEVVAAAGTPGRVTVATNMAGRGTDIRLPTAAIEAGGLHVVATERHDSRRIDRQLFGRCGRQGDPGSYEVLISAEDDLLTHQFPPSVLARLRDLLARRSAAGRALGALLVHIAQRAAESRHSRARRRLLRADEQADTLMAFSGETE